MTVPPESSDYGYADEVELIDLLRVLWDRKWLILGGTLACAALGFGASRLMTPMYESEATLLISQPKLQEGQPALPTSVPNLQALIQNRSIASQLLGELGLNEELTAAEFVDDRLSVEQIGDTSMLRVHVRMEHPDLAARAANRLAELAIELNRDLNQRETVQTRDFIRQQLDAAEARQDEAANLLVEARKAAGMEALRAEVTVLTARLGTLEADQFDSRRNLRWQEQDQALQRLAGTRDRLLEFQRTAELPRFETTLEVKLAERTRLEENRTDLAIEIEGLQARLAEAANQMSLNERFLESPSSIELAQPGRDETAQSASDEDEPPRNRSERHAVLRDDLTSPFLNPTYQVVELEAVTSRTRLSEATRRLTEVQRRLTVNAEELTDLQNEVARKNSTLEDLETRFELARQEYMRLTATSPEGFSARLTVDEAAEQETRRQLAQLQAEMYASEVRIDELEMQHELAQTIYADLAADFERSRLLVAGQTAQLQVVDLAAPPRKPVSPRVALNAVLALFAGAFFFTLLAFLIQYVQSAGARV